MHPLQLVLVTPPSPFATSHGGEFLPPQNVADVTDQGFFFWSKLLVAEHVRTHQWVVLIGEQA